MSETSCARELLEVCAKEFRSLVPPNQVIVMLHRFLGFAILLVLLAPVASIGQHRPDRTPVVERDIMLLERAVQAQYPADVLARFKARYEQQRPVPPLLERYFRQVATSPGQPDALVPGAKHGGLGEARSQNRAPEAAPRPSQHAAPASLAATSASPEAFQRFPFSTSVPAVFSLPGGEVLAVFETGGAVYGSRSPDAGRGWQEPVLIQGGDGTLLKHLQSRTGRLLLVYLDFTDFSRKVLYSDDHGATWQLAPLDVPQPANGYLSLSGLTQMPDGTLWWAGSIFDFGTYDETLVYTTSHDDGLTWSAPMPIDVGSGSLIFLEQIVSFGGDLLALAVNYAASEATPEAYRSADGGLTWTGPEPFLEGLNPSFVQDEDGIWWAFSEIREEILFPDYQTTNTDIMYQQSMDGGGSWGPITRLTQYAGSDRAPQAVLVDGSPLIFFQSRRDGFGVFYGTPAAIDPAPPVLVDAQFGLPKAETTFRVFALDETGIAEVMVTYGTGAGARTTALNDSGLGADWEAGDNVWTGRLGPVEWVACLEVESIAVTDVDGQVVTEFYDYLNASVRPVHDAGAVLLNMHPEGTVGLDGLFVADCSAELPWKGTLMWPKGDNYEFTDFVDVLNTAHLYTGGPWVAATVASDPAPRVINRSPFDAPTEWTATAMPVVSNGTGLSDQDITVMYDDQAAPRGFGQESPPLGIAVTQTSYQWSGANRDDFIMIAYDIHNTGAEGDLTDVAAGLFLDTDIIIVGGGPLNNIGSYDAESGLLYSTSTLPNLFGEPTAYVGLKVLGGAPQATTFFYNGGYLEPGSPLPGDPFDEATTYDYLVNGALTEATEPGDLRMLATAPLFDLPAGASGTAYFGIVMGRDLDELRANAAVMDLLHAAAFTEAPEGAGALASYVASLGLEPGLTKALTAKLRNAAASYARGKEKAGDNQVGAFINQVEAKRGTAIPDEEVDYLIVLAELLQANDAPVTAGKYDDLEAVADVEASAEAPAAFALAPNYPNPFNPATTVTFAVPTESTIRVAVYNVLGQQVRVLVDGSMAAGTHQVRFDAQGLSNGVYLLRMDTPTGNYVQQMLLMK